MPLRKDAELKGKDLAQAWKDGENKQGLAEGSKATQFQPGNDPGPILGKDPATGRFLPGCKPVGGGRKKGGNNKAINSIKAFTAELLDDEGYRRTLTKRIKAGELPGVELFLLTKALGKPREEIEITANVPLFALPTMFRLKEDEVDAESVKVLEEGDVNGGNPILER